MGHTTKPTRENRTITVDFHDETTYFELMGNIKAFLEFVVVLLCLPIPHEARMVKKPERSFMAGVTRQPSSQSLACIWSLPSRILNAS